MLISESGAIVDPNELAACLETTPEELAAQDQQILEASLEDLLEDLEGNINIAPDEDIPVDVLEPAMESILNVANGILDAGAISRSDAQALRQMTASLEGFQDTFTNMPMASFTELPSKVNYDASMESVLSTVGRKIVEIIKAIIKWVKEKAKAIVGFFRDNRMKAKKTEEASKKVSEALKASEKSLEEIFLSAVKPEHLKPDGQTEFRTRKKGQKVDLHINSLAAHLSDNPTSIGKVQTFINALSGGAKAMLTSTTDLQMANVTGLDSMLFAEKTPYTKGDSALESTAYLHAIAKRLASTVADVDVITTDTPEADVNKRLAVFDGSKMANLAMIMAVPLTNTANAAAKGLEEVKAEITTLTKDNVRLTNEDPLYVKARHYKAITQMVDDLNSVYGYVMKAWTDLISVGAKVAKDPGYGIAA
ncbi:hypothetical protein PA10_00194 [Pseudomonas phage pPa_SNUABM_DT01]|nr:hypothetical protein PA10_00194 [Pseudomonas phage pPa_SNUABM_DT01]